MPSCDSEAVFTASEGAGRNWGCTGDGGKWGSLWGWRDLSYLQGKLETPPGVGLGGHTVSEDGGMG